MNTLYIIKPAIFLWLLRQVPKICSKRNRGLSRRFFINIHSSVCLNFAYVTAAPMQWASHSCCLLEQVSCYLFTISNRNTNERLLKIVKKKCIIRIKLCYNKTINCTDDNNRGRNNVSAAARWEFIKERF